jgi:hypothetical protein
LSKYQVVSTKSLEVVGFGDDPKTLADDFDMRSHVILKKDLVFTPPKTNSKETETQPYQKAVVSDWWDFSVMSDSDKKKLVSNSLVRNFIKCKDLINKYKITIVCCSGQMDQILDQIKNAQRNGVLPVR